MENPGTILRRAKLSRRYGAESGLPLKRVEAAGPPPAQAPHRSSHASYTALMRSHDRMRTRHIGGQGGGSGA